MTWIPIACAVVSILAAGVCAWAVREVGLLLRVHKKHADQVISMNKNIQGTVRAHQGIIEQLHDAVGLISTVTTRPHTEDTP